MRPYRLPKLDKTKLRELEKLNQTTKDIRVRQRVDMVIFSAQETMVVSQIATIVRESESTVLRWLKRYVAYGTKGLADTSRSQHHD